MSRKDGFYYLNDSALYAAQSGANNYGNIDACNNDMETYGASDDRPGFGNAFAKDFFRTPQIYVANKQPLSDYLKTITKETDYYTVIEGENDATKKYQVTDNGKKKLLGLLTNADISKDIKFQNDCDQACLLIAYEWLRTQFSEDEISNNQIIYLLRYYSQTTLGIAQLPVRISSSNFFLFLTGHGYTITENNTINEKEITNILVKEKKLIFQRPGVELLFQRGSDGSKNVGRHSAEFTITESGFQLSKVGYENKALAELSDAKNPDLQFTLQENFLKTGGVLHFTSYDLAKKYFTEQKTPTGKIKPLTRDEVILLKKVASANKIKLGTVINDLKKIDPKIMIGTLKTKTTLNGFGHPHGFTSTVVVCNEKEIKDIRGRDLREAIIDSADVYKELLTKVATEQLTNTKKGERYILKNELENTKLNRTQVLQIVRSGLGNSFAGSLKNITTTRRINGVGTIDEPTGNTTTVNGADLSGLDLSKMQFTHVQAKTQNANGKTKFLEETEIVADADFSYCTLVGTDFSKSDLSNVKFVGANLSNAKFDTTIPNVLVGADFKDAKIDIETYRTINKILSPEQRKQLVDANSEFFIKKNYSYIDCSDKSFDSMDLTNANFRGAKLHGATFRNAILIGADLCDAKFHITENVFTDANFEDAKIDTKTYGTIKNRLSPQQKIQLIVTNFNFNAESSEKELSDAIEARTEQLKEKVMSLPVKSPTEQRTSLTVTPVEPETPRDSRSSGQRTLPENTSNDALLPNTFNDDAINSVRFFHNNKNAANPQENASTLIFRSANK